MDKTIEISDDLVKAAQEATGESDERAAIEHALRDYVATKQKQKTAIDGMLSLVGQVRLRDDYDYKALRAGDSDRD
jgi:Arc/MetJ family transcription regulator